MTKWPLLKTKSRFASFKDWPIAGKVLLLVLVPLILALTATQYLTFISLNRLETETSTKELQQEVTIFQQQFAEVEANLILNVSELTANPILQDALRRNDRPSLQALFLSTSVRSGLRHLEVVDADGQTLVVNRNFDLSGTLPEIQELHQLGLLQVTDATRLILTPSGWLMTTVRPVKLPSGEVIGALSIGRLLDDDLLSTLNFERTDLTLVVFNPEGNIINASKVGGDPEAGDGNNLVETFEVDRNLWTRAASGEAVLDHIGEQGELQWAVYAPLRLKDQIVTVFGVIPSTTKTTELRNQLITTSLIVAGVLGLLTILAAFSLARHFIVRPITMLAAGAEQITAGQLGVQVPDITSRDELGMLAATFNKMTTQLHQTVDDLKIRTQSLEIVHSLGDHLVSILNWEELLTQVVNQLKERFGYYHAHIYLVDDKGEKLVVVEGTGPAGAEMKARGHNIPLNAPTSLVARAARTRQIVQVNNVREAEDWLPNPLLPDTHSEMAVPIILEEAVVGVLDVQQDKIASLDERDMNVLRSLANQVAVAIRNARQFARVETALTEAHELQQRYIAQSWDRTRVVKKNVGRVQFSLGESTTLNETIIVKARQQALANQEPTPVTSHGNEHGDREVGEQRSKGAQESDSPYHALVAPIILHHVPIGDLQLHDVDPDRKWTESELALINAVIDQIAQAAENLRLLDESQERASREQLISQITNKMRRAPDVETLMNVAVTELSRVLVPARTFVHMGLKAELAAASPAAADSSVVDNLKDHSG